MNIPERGPGQRRIGVAVEVPAPYGAQLQEARARFGDAYADAIPPHVTLLGPTVVDEIDVDHVHTHLADVAAQHTPFRLHLRGSATFRPVSPVVFVQVVEGIVECEALESHVRSGLLHQELRFNYHPHVTVAHDLDDAALDQAFDEMAGFDATFDVAEIVLYLHGDDSVWRPTRRFSLTGEVRTG
ncbi:2'-5' RNA ligase family protein [Paraoerskovia marina]|uniref:2'-5' RNA ligase family protein n=1 Tax=Paraoerskovia marina TaxID=545619 RepID=UPI0009DD37A5|nr:2'-5' RNA ligase family protein [Paraoerskovia marina]